MYQQTVMVALCITTIRYSRKHPIVAKKQLSRMVCPAACSRCHASSTSTRMPAVDAHHRCCGGTCTSRCTAVNMIRSSTRKKAGITSWAFCRQAKTLRARFPKQTPTNHSSPMGATTSNTNHNSLFNQNRPWPYQRT